MKLLLTSESITNKSIADAFVELVGKPLNACKIVYVPTAGNPEKGDKGWMKMNMDNIRRFKPLSFDVVDISSAPKSEWLPIFQKSDVLAFGGGSAEYLLDQLEISGVKDALPDLLKTRIYFGSSAGGMVTAKKVTLSKMGILYWEKTGKFEDREGLGFVDFEIRPHFMRSDYPQLTIETMEKLARENPLQFYAIDDQTAIKVDGDKITLVSEGTWKKFN